MGENSANVVELLKGDHKKIERLLGELDSVEASGLEDYFCNLREELVRHEVAEEVVVYPALRKSAPNGDAIADACMAEQSEAEEELDQMEKVQGDARSLRPKLQKLRTAVLEHAQHEERDAFSLLESSCSREELVQLGQKYEKALSAAPTHPHPHAPDTPPGNTVMGPMAALVDKVRDAMKGAA
jgi:hemerythrin superfamily protein